MNKKGESGFNLQGMIIGLLVVGLFFGIIAGTIQFLGGMYSTEGYDEADIAKYNKNANLSSTIQSAQEKVEVVTVSSSVFDFFAGIWNVIITPFKFIYRTFTTLVDMVGDASSALQLMPVVRDFFLTVIAVLVIVGIVMIKFYMNREK